MSDLRPRDEAADPLANVRGSLDGVAPARPRWEWERELDDFESEVAEVCGRLWAETARLVRLVVRALDRGWWQQAGVRSPLHWLCWQSGVSPARARQIVGLAQRCADFPVTMAAFDAGELSFDQALVVAERAPSWADEQLCALAKVCTVGQLRTAVARYAFPDDPDADGPAPEVPGAGDPDPEAVDRGRDEPVENDDAEVSDAGASDAGAGSTGLAREFVSLVCDVDGTWRLSGRLGADHGLLLDAVLRESADALFRASGRAPSQLEALIEIAERSLDAVESRSRRDRYRVHLLVDELGATDPLGRRLPPWVLDLIGCDSSLAVTWTRDGVPIEQGPTGDTIPATTRRHVLARDGGCRVPGCGATRRLDVHHIAHRRDGGTHHPSNLIALCSWHHRLHHRGHLGIAGDAEAAHGSASAVAFTDEHHRVLGVNRYVRRPTRPPPPPAGRFLHPLGERIDMRWLHFTPPRRGARPSPDDPR